MVVFCFYLDGIIWVGDSIFGNIKECRVEWRLWDVLDREMGLVFNYEMIGFLIYFY